MAFPLHPIHRAIYEQQLNLDHIKALIASDPSCLAAVNTQNGYSLLHAAARRGDPALTRLLVQAGCYVDARTTNGMTPFMIACQIGIVRNLHILAEAGADSRATDSDGRSAVHFAALVGSVSVMNYLVEVLNLDPNITDKKGSTALHYAVQERVTPSIFYLLRHKFCDVDQANYAGLTPIHIAAKNGSKKVIWELMINAPNVDVLTLRDHDGFTAQQLAEQGKNLSHRYSAKLLSRWQSKPVLMRRIPWIYWGVFIMLPALFITVADLSFCCLDNPSLALVFGGAVAMAGFYFPVRPHRITHVSGWQNPALLGAMVAEVADNALCFFTRILPILWPWDLLMPCFLMLNTFFGLFVFWRFKTTDPGFDKVGKIGSDGKPMTILDIVNQDHGLSFFELEREAMKGSPSVLRFCEVCEIVIPDRTKHCKLCNACCNGFDHHCLWLTGCVGLNNHRLFVLFSLAFLLECVIFVWGGIVAVSVAMGEDFPFNLFESEAFMVEKWIKFRILVTSGAAVFAARVLLGQLQNISRLETTYFDLSGRAAYGKRRQKSAYSLRVRLKLVLLFFTDYSKWYGMSCQQSLQPSAHPPPHPSKIQDQV